MNIGSRLVQLAIVSLFLGFWEFYGKDAYYFIAGSYTMGTASLGYFIVLGTGFLTAYLVGRRIERK